MPFGEALKRAREAAGLSQSELARKAGVSLRTIQGWEQGRRSPVSPDFFRLASALGVSADSFAASVTGEEKRPRGRPRKGEVSR